MKKLPTVLAITLAFAGCAHAADIISSLRANNDKIVDVSIHGKITVNDDQRFHDAVQAIDETKTVLVKLDSPGGVFDPGIEIGNLIHRRGWTTWVPEKTVCGSICASIWIAGTHRLATNTSLIGFHAAYDIRSMQEDGQSNAVLGGYYSRMGLSDDAIAHLTLAGPNQVIYLTQESAQKYHILYEGALPEEGRVQLLLQLLAQQSSPSSPPSPPPPSGVATTVTENLTLRRDPDPLSPSVLEGLYPDYIPAGQHFSFNNFSQASKACKRINSGRFWCPLTYNTSDGQTREGWVNAYYLALNDGTRLACELDGSNSQIPECRIYLRAPPSPSPPQPSGVVTTVTENLTLRRDPDPLSPSVLEGLYPDYIPAGQHFSFNNPSNACKRIYSGKIWCPLTYNTSNGLRKGWVNAYYLARNSGTRLACELDGSNSQIPECRIYLRAPQ
jgi:hypothetical protein